MSTTTRRPKVTAEDREQHELFVSSWIARLSDMNVRVEVFNYAAMVRAGVMYSPADAWKGPRWRTEKFWTEEFRTMVDAGEVPRVVLSEWAERAGVAREHAAAADAEGEAMQELEQLAYLRELNAGRDALIVAARKRGRTIPEIVEAIGLKRSQIFKILQDAERAERIAETTAAEAARMADVYASWADDDGEPF